MFFQRNQIKQYSSDKIDYVSRPASWLNAAMTNPAIHIHIMYLYLFSWFVYVCISSRIHSTNDMKSAAVNNVFITFDGKRHLCTIRQEFRQWIFYFYVDLCLSSVLSLPNVCTMNLGTLCNTTIFKNVPNFHFFFFKNEYR